MGGGGEEKGGGGVACGFGGVKAYTYSIRKEALDRRGGPNITYRF